MLWIRVCILFNKRAEESSVCAVTSDFRPNKTPFVCEFLNGFKHEIILGLHLTLWRPC